MLGAIVDFLFPPHCPLCGAYVENRGDWCDSCLQKILQPRKIQRTASMQTVLDSVWALSFYRGHMKKLITDLKFNGRKDRLPYFSSFLTAVSQRYPNFAGLIRKHELAVPIPLHEQKLKQRGFNQVELIYGKFFAQQGKPLADILQRDRASQPMFQLNAEERKKNLKDIFSLRAGVQAENKSILLLDDILSTGTTFYEAARALKDAGAAQIDALVLASDH